MGKKYNKKHNSSLSSYCSSDVPNQFEKHQDGKDRLSSVNNNIIGLELDDRGNKKDAYQETREFLSDKLFEFIESQIEEIEVQDSDSKLFQFEIGDVSLFPGSPVLTDKLISSTASNSCPPPRKKKKIDKNLEKQRIKEAAVTVDWIRQQAKLFTS